METAMSLYEHQDLLETLPTADLLRFTREYVALYLGEAGEVQAEAANALDLLCAEFLRRGKERLYDAARGRVVHPVPASAGMRGVHTESLAELAELDFTAD
jgi:hypothetical protein